MAWKVAIAGHEPNGLARGKQGRDHTYGIDVARLPVVLEAVPIDPAIEASRQRGGIEQTRESDARQPECVAESRRSMRAPPLPTIGAITSCLRRASHGAAACSARSSAGRSANEANAAELTAPTLVPHHMDTRSPRSCSAGSSVDRAPTS
jgi:hypothetical protein